MSLATEMSEDVKEMESDLENPQFRFSNANYACVPSGITEGANLAEGGNEVVRTVILLARKSLFTTLPAKKNKITYPVTGGKDYTIDDVVTMPGETLIKITAHRKGKGV